MKLSTFVLPVIAAFALAACGNLSKVTKEGTTDNPVWPNPEKTSFRHSGTQNGSWPNWDNVRQIEDGELKTCQYKILFDKNQNAQSFYWLPEGCGPKKPEPVREVIVREVAPAPAARIRQ